MIHLYPSVQSSFRRVEVWRDYSNVSIPVAFSCFFCIFLLCFFSSQEKGQAQNLTQDFNSASKAASANPTHPMTKFCISVCSLNIQNGSVEGEVSFLCQELLPGIDVFSVDLYTICLVGTKNHGNIIKLQKLTSGRFKIWAQRGLKVKEKISQALFSGSKRIKFAVLYKRDCTVSASECSFYYKENS